MKLLQNILLFIIMTQSIVLSQLLIIKQWDLQSEFNNIYNTLTFNNPTYPLKENEYRFYDAIRLATHKKIASLNLFTLQNKFLIQNCYNENRKIRHQVELYAKELLGTHYVWGATGPNTFDCSGFTQNVYRTAGIKIPRNSRAQAKIGQYIPYEKLKRGDMVFFATNKKQLARVNHVGIYLEDGKFIHASSGSKKVVITNFEEKRFYKTHFLWGRRIINTYKVNKSIPIAFTFL